MTIINKSRNDNTGTCLDARSFASLRRYKVLAISAFVTIISIVGGVQIVQLVERSQNYAKFEKEAAKIVDSLERTVLYGEKLGVTSALGIASADVADVILGNKNPDEPELLKTLNRLKFLYSASLIYVMNAGGDVVASTPYGDGLSLTGKNYAFRPYFKQAMKGFGTVYPALGVTTNKRGLYYASPVYNSVNSNKSHEVIGVFVMKMGLLEAESFLCDIDSPVALASPLGIVFASNVPDWRFKSAFGVDPKRFDHLRDNKQFNLLFSEHLPDKTTARLDRNNVTLDGIEYASKIIDMSLSDEFGKWKLVYLKNISLPWRRNSTAMFSAGAIFLVCGFGTIAFFAYEKKRTADAERLDAQRIAARFGKILEDSLNEIYIFDGETYRFIQVNRGARENLGYSMDEMRLLKPTDLKPDVTDEHFDELISPLRSGAREEVQFRTRHCRKDGSIYPVEVHVQLSTVESSQVFVAMIVDITARQLAEERLQTAKEEAEAANIAKSEFLANMSHEIRTPMNAIIGFGDILAEEQLTPEQHKFVKTICSSGKHLLELINDILDFSKIEAGKLEICMGDCSVETLLADIESLMRPAAVEKGLKFDILQCSSRLPANIRTDGARLRQCLINVINNAIKFTEQGHVYVNVAVDFTEATNPMMIFSIEDTGIGIPPDRQELIFDSFKQADGTMARQYGGTGLGLAITRQLSGLLGGDISVTSDVGTGSVFTMKIPAGCDCQKNGSVDIYARAVDVAQNPAEAEKVDCPASVLVAEDAVHNQILIRTLLERMGLCVTIAEDGLKAVELAEANDYDMIFMDIQMPRMNGYEATRTLRSKGIETPIVAVTANAMKGDEEQCLRAGCDAYIKKPIDRKQLQEVIDKYMRYKVGTYCRLEATDKSSQSGDHDAS